MLQIFCKVYFHCVVLFFFFKIGLNYESVMIYLYIWTNKCEEFPVMDISKLLSNTHGVMKITWLPPTGGGDANQEVEGECTHQTSLKGYYGETWKERCTFGWESIHGDVSDDVWTQRYIHH